MQFPTYRNPPLIKFACLFHLDHDFETGYFAAALLRCYEQLERQKGRVHKHSDFLVNSDGLEIVINPKNFSVGVSSQAIRSDFLDDTRHESSGHSGAKFTDISNWTTLKQFIATAVLLHKNPSRVNRIELVCHNQLPPSADVHEIGRWINSMQLNRLAMPEDIQECDELVQLPEMLIFRATLAYYWQDGIFIAVEIQKDQSRPIELIITSRKEYCSKHSDVTEDWYYEIMELLESLRNANFLTFNSLLTQEAKSAFEINEKSPVF
jgi:hypothetical protein